jgi:hypothetical protein
VPKKLPSEAYGTVKKNCISETTYCSKCVNTGTTKLSSVECHLKVGKQPSNL